MERLCEPVTLADIAAHANVSLRTFTRHFRNGAGASPGRWLIRQRVDLAPAPAGDH